MLFGCMASLILWFQTVDPSSLLALVCFVFHAQREEVTEAVESAQSNQAHFYDRKPKPIELAVGDKVLLLSPSIRTQRPSKKLDWKRLGPYSITERTGLQAYRLALPSSMKIHPVF